jgi:hypothetical protein
MNLPRRSQGQVMSNEQRVTSKKIPPSPFVKGGEEGFRQTA